MDKGLRILIIDNSPLLCQELIRIYDKLGYRTLSAHEGGEGLTLAVRRIPDLIVLDLQMPDMDGLAVCQRLKSGARTQDLPVLVFTGRTRIADIMQVFDAGADMFIAKGLGYEKLINYSKAVLTEQGCNAGEVDHNLAKQTCRELLNSLLAGFEGLVRPRLELTLGTGAATTLLQKATWKLPTGWRIESLREDLASYLCLREIVVQYNTFVSEVFHHMEESPEIIEVSHLKEAFEQQLALLD